MPHITFGQIILLYLIIINLITFFLYGYDKSRARKHRWRVPERTLILFAVFGGSVGALIAMFFFHHKTRHAKFFLGIPLILAIQLAIPIIYVLSLPI